MKCVECANYAECSKKYNLTIKRKRCPMANDKYVQTNADLFRGMSDEELAENLYRFCDLEERIGYCKNLAECEKLLETEDGIPEKKCIGCLLDWLKQPAEVKKDGEE